MVKPNLTVMFLKENRYSRPYFESFLIAIVLIWLPSKMLGYIVPFICLGWFTLRSNSGLTLIRILFIVLAFAVLILFYWCFYTFFSGSYMLSSSVLSFITYGSFIYILSMPAKLVLDEKLYFRIIKIIMLTIIIEGSIGILQFIGAFILRSELSFSKGDVVQGTISPLSFLATGDMGIGNQIFAINIAIMLIFFIPYVITYKKGYFVLFIGVISLLLTVASHIIFSLVIAVLITWVLFQKFSFKLRKGTVFIAFTIAFSFFMISKISSESFHLASFYWKKYTEFKSLKILATVDAFNKIPNDYPAYVFIGLGPGQYSSRAGLISSGRYLGGGYDKPKKIPFFPTQVSEPFKKYGLSTFIEYLSNPTYGSSTMSRPFYSVLSIICEFGWFIFALIIVYSCTYIYKLKLFYQNRLKSVMSFRSYYLFACAVIIIFLAILSFFENYLEVPQAIISGLMILRLFYSFFLSKKDLASDV